MNSAEELAASLGVTAATIENRLHAVGLDRASRASLRAVAEPACAGVEGFLDAFYDRLRQSPETASLLSSDARVARLKAAQREYLRELFSAEIDWRYALRRLDVGVAHHRVRLAPQWYIASYAHFVCDHLAPIFAASADVEVGVERCLTLLKTALFDAGLALDAYGRIEVAALWHRDARAPAAGDAAPTPTTTSPRPAEGPAEAPRGGYLRIRLASEQAGQRRAYLGLTDEDLALLHELRGEIAAHTPAVLDDFYDYFSQTPETAEMVPPATATRLRRQVASYWQELAEGLFDAPYAASRMRIGVIHEKVGLEAQWYLAGLSRQVVRLLRALTARHPRPAEVIRAVTRAVLFDVTFVIDAYMEARVDTLLRSEGYAQQLVAGLASGVAILDARDRLISANPVLLSLVGGDPALLYLSPVAHALPGLGVETLARELRAGGGTRVVAIVSHGGRSLRVTAMSLREHARPEGAVAVVLDDITDVLRVGAELDRQSDHFEHLADAVGSVLWELDDEVWTITAINRAALGLTGLRDVYFLGRRGAWNDRVAPDDRARFEGVVRALRPGEHAELEYRMLRGDGAEVWVRTRVARPADRPRGAVIGATTDVTAARRSQALRLDALALLAGGVAHVVNNSLTGVLCNIELHADARGGLEQSPLLRDAVDATRRATTMVSQLLAFAGRQVLRSESLSLAEVVRAAAPGLVGLAGPSLRLHLRVDAPELRCRVDRVMLTTALGCLVDNAREAMPTGGDVWISTRHRPAPFGVGLGHCEVEVRDDGGGMSAEVRARAVEPFFSTRSLAEAAGLGLSMVYGFVTQSGGEVSIESAPGAGTSVSLRFPALPSADEGGAAGPAEASVLLVEDDPGVRVVAAAMIRRLGFAVHEASTAAVALRLARSKQPAIVLADVVLGDGVDGVSLAAQILQERPGIAVILTSGYPATRFDLSALPAGYQFLPKPFSLASLRHTLSVAAGR